MDEIWGYDCESAWCTLTVHIGRLRQKFGSCPEFQLVTVRGIGYKGVILNSDQK